MKSIPPERSASEWHGIKLMGSAEMGDRWRYAGASYRLGRALLVIALVSACVAGGFVATILTHASSGRYVGWASQSLRQSESC